LGFRQKQPTAGCSQNYTSLGSAETQFFWPKTIFYSQTADRLSNTKIGKQTARHGTNNLQWDLRICLHDGRTKQW